MDTFETLAIQILLENKAPIHFRATGSSMRPFILNGDSVEIQPVISSSIRYGHIVLYQLATGRLLIHRVVRVNGNKLLIQGDALTTPDGWMNREQVLGVVSAVFRNGKERDFTSPFWITSGRLWAFLTPLRCWLQILRQRWYNMIAFP